MKANPNVIKMAQEQMAKMSPEQMKQASELAQKQMEAMAPEDLEKMADSAIAGAGGPQVVDVDVEEDAPARNARDEALVDALFVVAAAMSKQPGAVTLEAFKQLPPIQSLRGELPDDLSDAEIADAWAKAGLAVGAAADPGQEASHRIDTRCRRVELAGERLQRGCRGCGHHRRRWHGLLAALECYLFVGRV